MKHSNKNHKENNKTTRNATKKSTEKPVSQQPICDLDYGIGAIDNPEISRPYRYNFHGEKFWNNASTTEPNTGKVVVYDGGYWHTVGTYGPESTYKTAEALLESCKNDMTLPLFMRPCSSRFVRFIYSILSPRH